MPPLDEQTAAFIAALVRVSAFTVSSPVTSVATIPAKVRASFAVALAFITAAARPPLSPEELWGVLPGELMLGLVGGFAIRLALAGIEAAGHLMGMLLGIGFASFYDPSSGDQSLPTGRIAFYLAAIAFLDADGLQHAIRALAVAPPVSGDVAGLMVPLLRASGDVLGAALRTCGPLLLAMMASNLTAALASKAAPALNAFSVMLALFLLVGLLVLVATAPAFVRELADAGVRAGDAIDGVVGR